MNFNTSNYFAYKRQKAHAMIQEPQKPISKLNFIFQLFVATFVIIFIAIVIFIMKYSSKIDIEYTKGEMLINQEEINNSPTSYANNNDDEQKTIDKRLILIQQEENAPSEAKIVDKKKEVIIDPKHIQKEKKQAQKQEKPQEKPKTIIEEVENNAVSKVEETTKTKNIIVTSKVLIGRYQTIEQAQRAQNQLKMAHPKLSPFVKKYGDVYSVQMGSYQDFQIAKYQAQILKSKGYDVWIFQQ
ncbi:MAG: SPOR domain-containing protein [Candidatus Gastranaerophilales bacterium]|nr:SPOR domain-containing protein [Candidatus Gastranaerophilales bacterium]